MNIVSYRRSSRGPVITRLQEKLHQKPDGVFGRDTMNAVRKEQEFLHMPVTGHADQQFFELGAGLQWPDEFTRCMNMASAIEGTSFGDVNDRDIDGWGITLGVTGMTSRTNEVQALFREMLAQKPDAIDHMLTKDRLAEFKQLCITGFKLHQYSNRAWCIFAYNPTTGRIREDFGNMVHELGKDPLWQKLQLEHAKSAFWDPAVTQCVKMGIGSMAGRGLMYDVWIQNGGWRDCHQRFIAQCSLSGAEIDLLRAIARAAGHCATAKWQSDVLKRKMLYVDGGGIAHGDFFDLAAYAFSGFD